jgi:hypothetical protein
LFWPVRSSRQAEWIRTEEKMPRKDPAAVSPKKFFGQYASQILENDARDKRRAAVTSAGEFLACIEKGDYATPPRLITTSQLGEEVRKWWPVGLLRKAARENQSEDYKRVLTYLLDMLGVPPPDGVLVPFRWKRGRPEETEMIHQAWLAMGKSLLNWRVLDQLAKTFYPDQFTQAVSDGKLRKKLRDRVRNTIRRYEPAAPATKP